MSQLAARTRNAVSIHAANQPVVPVTQMRFAWVPLASASRIVPAKSAVQTVAAVNVASVPTAPATMNAKVDCASATQAAPQARNAVSIRAVALHVATVRQRPPTATTTYANRTHVCPIVTGKTAAATAAAEAAVPAADKTS